MAKLIRALRALGFSETHRVEGRASIADLFPAQKRCGIYLLQFSSGEIYIGQALDVARRYVQHVKTHGDIEKISFKRLKRNTLDEHERVAIWALEKEGFKLRNISLTSIPKGESDFDLVMPPKRQQKWLEDLHYSTRGGQRVNNSELRRKYAKRFHRFEQMTYASGVIEVLRKYVRTGIPAIRRGEISFWSCSCLPLYSKPQVRIYSRVNVYWQEVFTAYTFEDELYFSWHLARSPLEASFGKSLSRLEKRHPDLLIDEHYYESGGKDQIKLVIQGIDAALRIIEDIDIRRAVRLFNSRLMKKGPCVFNRYHYMDLADAII
jgi:hypothetical protein